MQADAALPVHEVGDRVGLSSNACWRRIKRLEESGVIARRVALLDPRKLGLTTTVYVAVRTNRHDPEWLAAFSRGVAGGTGGLNQWVWNGLNGAGKLVSSGGYIVMIEAQDTGQTVNVIRRKIAVVR